ncbi:hypothetical protein FHX42_004829 [Saccharopolyspora lacisalsi]|uniref:Alpha-glucosidase n=1 Tax=Halosaccharopolyspora lacisalsi TaxID=1000566 RepID=A0A839E2E0_9PSEU|nr:glycoside hydrolase family 97 protein [Halosaccharopolyspora lacisalsi]MBA8827433.1 hypothetical protein [Halosaccharopolyspora lacisalsi]
MSRHPSGEPLRPSSKQRSTRSRPRRALFGGLLALCLVWTGNTASANPAEPDSWTVTEPDRPPNSQLGATVSLTADGALRISVRRGERTVLEPSALGITTSDADFGRGLTFLSREDRRVERNYTTPVGKRHRHHSTARQTRLSFRSENGGRMDLLIRVADDGVAYRYVLPEPDGEVVVESESSSFRVPASSPAWMAPWGDHYEKRWSGTEVGDAPAGEYGYPALLRVGRDDYVLLSESDVIDQYGATRLTLDGSTFEVTLPDPQQTSAAPMVTPWRTMIIGDLGQVVESDFVEDLAPSSRIEDTSWIEPGRVSWSWWSDHDSPGDLRTQRAYVDYAAEQGWEYALVDAGWKPEWMPGLVDYARERGVRIIAWLPWTEVDTEAERAERLPRWKSWGIAGLKIDYMDSDSQEMMRWYDEVLKDTARLRMTVNFHGATIPHGVQREWPHVMTMEAVRGAEYYTFGEGEGNTAAHNTVLPYTRNVIGSMDYTPVTFSTDERTTSDGHELGLSVVYESGMQHFADSVESYRRHPVAERFLAEVPAAWDETRFLGGHPGEGQIIARKHGADWFVGGIFAGSAHEVTVPFEFLPGGRWRVELFRDGPNGLVTDTRTVTRDSRITVGVADNGGFAARACRAGHGPCGTGG